MKLQPQERWGPGLREGNTGEHTQKLPEEKVLFPLQTGVLPGLGGSREPDEGAWHRADPVGTWQTGVRSTCCPRAPARQGLEGREEYHRSLGLYIWKAPLGNKPPHS